MNILFLLTVSSVLADLISSETTKEPSNAMDVQQTLEAAAKDYPKVNTEGLSPPRVNSLWVNRIATNAQDSQADDVVKHVSMKPAHSLTRLAKTLTLGFDPFFSKGHFEPFERRPKPVTLVAFRKNGLVPKAVPKQATASKSAEVAEIQSPFNDIGNFWDID